MDASLFKAILGCTTGVSGNLSTLTQFQELRALTPQMVNTIGYENPARTLTSTLDTLVDEIPTLLEENSGMRDTDLVLARVICLKPSISFRLLPRYLLGRFSTASKMGMACGGIHFSKRKISTELLFWLIRPKRKSHVPSSLRVDIWKRA